MGEVGLPVQLKKMYGAPINPDSVFSTLEDAVAYAAGPLGAPGEILGVRVAADSNDYDIYIVNEDKTISNKTSSATDLSEILDSLVWKTLE